MPWRSKGQPWREQVTAWAVGRWGALLPDAEILVVDSGRDPFCHASSFNLGAQRAAGDTLVLVDADTAVRYPVLEDAVWVAERGGWALAERYCALTETQSRAVLRGAPLSEPPDPEWLGVETSWAGFLVIARDAYLDLGGYDERIWGWGPDDVAIAAKLDTLLAPHVRVPGTVYHLWHDRDLVDTYGVEGYHAKRDLAEAYEAARGDPDAMRALMGGVMA